MQQLMRIVTGKYVVTLYFHRLVDKLFEICIRDVIFFVFLLETSPSKLFYFLFFQYYPTYNYHREKDND